jgi:hypothetical protein
LWTSSQTTWTPGTPDLNPVLSSNGIHWHPHLAIVIKGKEEIISKDVGLGAVHQPLHTHDTDGILHLEIPGIVRLNDTRLSRFFDIWGKIFTRECWHDHSQKQ